MAGEAGKEALWLVRLERGPVAGEAGEEALWLFKLGKWHCGRSDWGRGPVPGEAGRGPVACEEASWLMRLGKRLRGW